MITNSLAGIAVGIIRRGKRQLQLRDRACLEPGRGSLGQRGPGKRQQGQRKHQPCAADHSAASVSVTGKRTRRRSCSRISRPLSAMTAMPASE